MCSISRAVVPALLVACSEAFQLRSLTETDVRADIDVDGNDCFRACGNHSGHCVSVCGPEQVCCRLKDPNDPPECGGASPTSDEIHECVTIADAGPTLEEVAAFHDRIVAKELPVAAATPSISVYVFSRVDGWERREEIRDMWVTAKKDLRVKLNYKFAVCGGAGNTINKDFGSSSSSSSSSSSLIELKPRKASLKAPAQLKGATEDVGDDGEGWTDLDDATRTKLKGELKAHGDVLYLDCEEGYGEGALTLKVLASMGHFWSNTPNDYFMKIDDDTFISWNRYVPQLVKKGHGYLYMGIPIGEGVPCRNENFRWYEPFSTYKKELFPKGMSGGSGYTVGKSLVDMVLNVGIGKSHVLYNEDRAVGVWMDTINRAGTEVDYEGIDGVDGFWAWDWGHPNKIWKTWGDFKYTLFHGLEGATIGCLAKASQLDSKENRIDQCFQPEVGKEYEELACAQLNKDAEADEKTAKLKSRRAAREAASREVVSSSSSSSS